MTTTDGERREIAERLREYAGEDEVKATCILHDVLMGAGCGSETGDADCEGCFNDVIGRLVDLIEPDRDLACEWVSVDDRLPDCKGEYIVAYHPCCWDNVKYDKVLVGMDSFTGKSSWYRRKYQRVTHWMPKPEPPRAKVVAE